jgi:hypothetical protein
MEELFSILSKGYRAGLTTVCSDKVSLATLAQLVAHHGQQRSVAAHFLFMLPSHLPPSSLLDNEDMHTSW